MTQQAGAWNAEKTGTIARNPEGAWFVRFVDGVVDTFGKGDTDFVRAVRGGCVD